MDPLVAAAERCYSAMSSKKYLHKAVVSDATKEKLTNERQRRHKELVLRNAKARRDREARRNMNQGELTRAQILAAVQSMSSKSSAGQVKVYFKQWKLFLKIRKLENDALNRAKAWQSSCVHDDSAIGGCAACSQLISPDFTVWSKPPPAREQTPEPVSMWRAAEMRQSLRGERRRDALQTSSSLPSLHNAGASGRPPLMLSDGQLGRSGRAFLGAAQTQAGGSWEEATHRRTGQTCYYNRATGQMMHWRPDLSPDD